MANDVAPAQLEEEKAGEQRLLEALEVKIRSAKWDAQRDQLMSMAKTTAQHLRDIEAVLRAKVSVAQNS
jgi:hypothetical protein